MNLYLRYKTWWVRYVHKGRLVRRSLHTHERAVAESVLASLRIARGGVVPRRAVEAMLDAIYGVESKPQAPATPLASAWAVYEDVARSTGLDRVAPDTWRKRRGRFEAFAAWIAAERPVVETVEAVDGQTAAAYAAHLRASGLKDKTRLSAIADLSTVWTTLSKASSGLRNPWTGLRPRVMDQETLEPFTRDEESRILEAARRIGHDWHGVCAVGRHTSLRYGDCATLRRDEVDLASGVITRKPRKTARHRVAVRIPIEAGTLMPALREAMARPARGDDLDAYLFPEHAHYYLMGETSHSKMPVQFADVLAAAGVPRERHTFHSWRHTMRTRLGEAEVPIETAMEICGHLTQEMSRRYDHADHIDAKRAAVEAAAK